MFPANFATEDDSADKAETEDDSGDKVRHGGSADREISRAVPQLPDRGAASSGSIGARATVRVSDSKYGYIVSKLYMLVMLLILCIPVLLLLFGESIIPHMQYLFS